MNFDLVYVGVTDAVESAMQTVRPGLSDRESEGGLCRQSLNTREMVQRLKPIPAGDVRFLRRAAVSAWRSERPFSARTSGPLLEAPEIPHLQRRSPMSANCPDRLGSSSTTLQRHSRHPARQRFKRSSSTISSAFLAVSHQLISNTIGAGDIGQAI